MPCPSKTELVALAFGDSVADAITLRHVETCRSCIAELASLREAASVMQVAAASSGRGALCLDEAVIAAAATVGVQALDANAVAHLGECAYCRSQLSGALVLLEAPEIANELTQLRSGAEIGRRRRTFNLAGAALLAAAIAGVVVIPQLTRMRADGTARGARDLRDSDSTITMTLPPRALSPSGAITRADTLVWTSVSGADRYSVTLFNSAGDVLWAAETTDTTAAVPRGKLPRPNQRYFWKVAAHTGWSRTAESDLVEFKISPPAR
jgi:hypothetical protein